MSAKNFFEGEEGYAIVRVPEEFADAIEKDAGSDFIGSVTLNAKKILEIKLETMQLRRKYKLDLKPKKDIAYLLREVRDEKEDKAEIKISQRIKFEGACYALDIDEMTDAITSKIEKDVESTKLDTIVTNKLWTYEDLQPVESSRGKERDYKFYTDNDLKDEIFKLFNRKDYYELDELVEETNSSRNLMEKIMKEIGFQVANKVYRLKDQYLRHKISEYEPPQTKKVKN